MVQFPQGVAGWTIFVTGLLIIAYRVHGIDAPRSWIEWVERVFVNTRRLQLLGGILSVGVLVIIWQSTTPPGLLGWLFIVGCTALFVLGVSLIGAINHVRHLVIATAQAEDVYIRYISVGVVVIGLLWALAPWFL